MTPEAQGDPSLSLSPFESNISLSLFPFSESNHDLRSEDFFIAMMNKGQEEMMTKFGNDVVVIDSTHGTNAYGFQLTTIMVLDDTRKGFAVAYMIASRTDTETSSLFFSLIKERTGNVTPKAFMTDDFPAFYNAWEEVMGSPCNRLLCSWHVLRSWTKNLSKIKDSDARTKCYDSLKMLMRETDEETFEVQLHSFIATYGNFLSLFPPLSLFLSLSLETK